MRNAAILAGLWVGIILTAYSLVYLGADGPAPAQLALMEQLSQRTYVDAEGRFQFEKPPGWRAEDQQGVVHAVGPLERMEAWIFFIEDATIAQAAQVACEYVDPCPGKEVESIESEMPPGFALAKERIRYTTGDEETFLYAVGYLVPDGVLVLLVRGIGDPLEARQTDLTLLEEGLTVVDPVDPPTVDDLT